MPAAFGRAAVPFAAGIEAPRRGGGLAVSGKAAVAVDVEFLASFGLVHVVVAGAIGRALETAAVERSREVLVGTAGVLLRIGGMAVAQLEESPRSVASRCALRQRWPR